VRVTGTLRLMNRSGVAAAVVAIAVSAGCGGHGTTPGASAPRLQADRPIPGAPNTPAWLRIRIWRMVAGLGDPTPEKIVVRLGIREDRRTVDRVWARGDFVCDACSRPAGARAPHGHVAGFTVNARTHRDLSFSISG
jgi:hypothetical protein